jgi:hypothetical protein
MSKFYVGQRVRVVADGIGGATGLIGAEGVVNELDCESEWGQGGQIGIEAGGEDDWCFEPEHLEPLQPERNQTIAWSECVWKPEHMRSPTCA